MLDRKRPIACLSALALTGCVYGSIAAASVVSPAAVPAIVEAIDDSKTEALSRDVPLSMHKVTDNGALADEKVLQRLQLVLKRSDARQAALDKLVADQLDKTSARYHQWMAPDEFAASFGPAQSDVQKTVAWLQGHGFTVEEVAADRMSIAFTGTAGQVKSVFKTELHSVVAEDGKAHTANMAAPVIPAALAGVVDGVTLSNFFPTPTSQAVGAVARNGKTGKYTITKRAPQFTLPDNSGYYAVAPADLATIYNFTPARAGTTGAIYDQNGDPLPLTGKGVSLIVAEQSDIKTSDWTTFRKLFGLSKYTSGSLKVVHPGGCADPGFIPDEGEAALDAEWSSAAAPDAQIIFASCAETETTFGVMTTLQNLVSHGPKAAAISISYGGCEVGNGLSFLHEWSGLVEEAAAEGYSVFVSSGDNAVAGCYTSEESPAEAGLGVNGLASNPYDTVAGGTDFSDGADNDIPTYWSNKNGPGLGSAKSYIPEIPWDDSCAGSVFIKYIGATDPVTSCNTAPGNELLNIIGGSGGKSLYYAKPAWQNISGLSIPKDGARDLPDVSLFASNGFWGHFYVFCMSDVNEGGAPCSTTNLDDIFAGAAGGTSFVAPILAGVQALVVQEAGANVGNAAPVYYQLAKLQFETPYLLSTCKSNLGYDISPACVFNEITRGDIAVPCVKGTPNCYTNHESTAGIGVLSTSLTADDPAYNTDLGYSYATGLGSINVTNLLINYLYP